MTNRWMQSIGALVAIVRVDSDEANGAISNSTSLSIRVTASTMRSFPIPRLELTHSQTDVLITPTQRVYCLQPDASGSVCLWN